MHPMKPVQGNHAFYMKEALKQAKKAYAQDEVPVGALVVDANGAILARAYNLVEKRHTQGAHAEALAIDKAGKKLSDWRLEGCWIYVTLEPCAMCLHLILMSRLEGLVFGATSPLFGYHLDKLGTLSIYTNKHLPIQVVDEVHAAESAELLKQFFMQKRESKRE